jgi:hypothetical protein
MGVFAPDTCEFMAARKVLMSFTVAGFRYAEAI